MVPVFDLKNLVYRIQMVCKLIFDSSTNYKIFATEDYKIFKSAAQIPAGILPPKEKAEVAEFEVVCPKCGQQHTIYIKFSDNEKIDVDFQKKGSKPYPTDNKLKCDNCGFSIDLGGVKNQLEMQTGKKAVLKEAINETK